MANYGTTANDGYTVYATFNSNNYYLTNLSLAGLKALIMETTNSGSANNTCEYEGGMIEPGKITLAMNFNVGDSIVPDGVKRTLTIVFPTRTFSSDAILEEPSFDQPVKEKGSRNVTFQLSGQATWS